MSFVCVCLTCTDHNRLHACTVFAYARVRSARKCMLFVHACLAWCHSSPQQQITSHAAAAAASYSLTRLWVVCRRGSQSPSAQYVCQTNMSAELERPYLLMCVVETQQCTSCEDCAYVECAAHFSGLLDACDSFRCSCSQDMPGYACLQGVCNQLLCLACLHSTQSAKTHVCSCTMLHKAVLA
jgi:hypothetical protein